MIAHASIPVRDYEKAKEFYKKSLAPLGYTMNMDHPEWNAGGFSDGNPEEQSSNDGNPEEQSSNDGNNVEVVFFDYNEK